MEENISQLITTIIAVFTLTLCIRRISLWRRRNRNLPPGDRSYGLAGSAFEIGRLGIREVIERNRQKYGDIFTLRAFSTLYIVCNGYDVLKEMMVQNGRVFIDRTPSHVRDGVFGGKGIVYASGEIWKHNRRLTLRTLRDFGMGKNTIEMKIHEEINHFLDAVEMTNGEPFDIGQLLTKAIANVIGSTLFGERFDYNDRELTGYLDALSKTTTVSRFFRYQWFRHIPGDPFGVKTLNDSNVRKRAFYEKQINKHLQDFDENNVRDFTDVYIKQMKKANGTSDDSLFNVEELVVLTHDIFGAGIDTTTTALRWALVYIMRDNDLQSDLHKELDSCVTCSRLPASSDKVKLPYLEATTLEILRFGRVIPITGRSVSEDTEFRGFTFRKSVEILINLESVLMDGKYWAEPHKFNPSRFLDSGSVSKIRLEKLINFGMGPRVCLGESLARMELFLFLAAMLQRFQFLPPLGENPPNVEGIYMQVHKPKPYKVRAIKRND